MRRAFFFIVAIVFATTSYASIPRASMLDRASEDASAFASSLPETRIRVSEVLAPFERPYESELTRALRQAYEQPSTTDASGLRCFLSVDPVLDIRRALPEPQRWNRYSYVVNNPINRIDPDGRADLKSEVASGVFGFLPVAGEIQDATIALTGFDPITAEQQSGWVRGASVAAVFIPFVGAKALGEAGEAGARIVGNAIAGARFEKAVLSALGVGDVAKTRIPSISGTAAYRVPDALTAKSVIEVKGVAKLGATNQIKDFAAFAKESGRQFILVVRKDTVLTKELEKMASDGLVQIQRR